MSKHDQNSAVSSTYTVLVTGANSGLGLATCCRLIDEFLHTRASTQTIHVLFTTRDTKKRSQTLKNINAHLKHALKEVAGKDGSPAADRFAGPRVLVQGVLVDLTRLLTVKALAHQLTAELGHVDAVVCNAGIGGWTGLNWPMVMYSFLFDFMQAVTFPTFQTCAVGAVTKPQLRGHGDEPALGEVFAANVFGHYMLVHWLSSLLNQSSRIIWVSSLSAQPKYFSPNDFQRLEGSEAYESSKRITDLMVLTSELPSTARYVRSFFPSVKPAPVMYLTHPGVVHTGIAGLPAWLGIFILAALWIARWLGSPWHTIKSYTGAVSAVWTCLASEEQLRQRELTEGKGKWGSTVTVYGDEGVHRTEIEGWGYGGTLGPAPVGSVAGKHGRWRQRTRLTEEKRVQFEEDGVLVWRELENLRKQWEKRLEASAEQS